MSLILYLFGVQNSVYVHKAVHLAASWLVVGW